MEALTFEGLNNHHSHEVMEIFNYYVENSYSAYPEKELPVAFFGRFLEMTKGYPAYVLKINDKVIGFCFLRAYNPFPTFSSTAEISYFIAPGYSGKGYGKQALHKLENDAKNMGIETLLASITSENTQSLAFHQRNGFDEYGCFPSIGRKFGKSFDIRWMGKKLTRNES